jgi:hypothetical protein
MLGNGSGGFTPALNSPFWVGPYPALVCAAVGDFNGDGFLDLVTSSNGASVLLGDGTGNFTLTAASPLAVGGYPSSIAVGDFNGDGVQDLALALGNSGTIAVLLGNGKGGFAAATGSPKQWEATWLLWRWVILTGMAFRILSLQTGEATT